MKRRHFLIGGAACVFCQPTEAAGPMLLNSTRTPNTFGCCLADSDVDSVYPNDTDTRLFITGDEPMIPRSGDKDFDYALAQTLSKISDCLDVLPGFAYYDDYDGMNAYATPTVRLDKADGTVVFGQGMLSNLRAGPDHPEIAVAAVCAHEFGHILQYKRGLSDALLAGQPTVKRVELQADFFAGYFAGVRKRERPAFAAAVFAQTQYNFGDDHVSSRGHHGTPDERSEAVVAGFHVGSDPSKSLGDAIQIGNNYAMSL